MTVKSIKRIIDVASLVISGILLIWLSGLLIGIILITVFTVFWLYTIKIGEKRASKLRNTIGLKYGPLIMVLIGVGIIAIGVSLPYANVPRNMEPIFLVVFSILGLILIYGGYYFHKNRRLMTNASKSRNKH